MNLFSLVACLIFFNIFTAPAYSLRMPLPKGEMLKRTDSVVTGTVRSNEDSRQFSIEVQEVLTGDISTGTQLTLNRPYYGCFPLPLAAGQKLLICLERLKETSNIQTTATYQIVGNDTVSCYFLPSESAITTMPSIRINPLDFPISELLDALQRQNEIRRKALRIIREFNPSNREEIDASYKAIIDRTLAPHEKGEWHSAIILTAIKDVGTYLWYRSHKTDRQSSGTLVAPDVVLIFNQSK